MAALREPTGCTGRGGCKGLTIGFVEHLFYVRMVLVRNALQLLCSILFAAALSQICSAAEINTNTPLRDLGDGRFQIGAVVVDSKLKSITFPAAVNMTTGMVEYVLVTTTGKVHESLLSTQAEPFHIHTAMLLLGVRQATNSATAPFFDAKQKIPGPRIRIDLTIPGPELKTVPVQTFLAFASSRTQVKTSDIPTWIYNGSRFSESTPTGPPSTDPPSNSSRTFLAQREGSIVSLIADPAALVNNARPDRENDELWILHTPAVPPMGTAVQVSFILE